MSASIYCTYEALGALLNLTMQYLFVYQDKPVGMFSILDHSTSKHFFLFFQGRGASMAIGGIVLNHSQYMRTCPPVYRNKVLLKHSHGQLLACIHSTMAVLRVATERTFTIRSGEMARSGKVLATQSGYLSGRRELTFASCCLSSMHTVTFTPMYVHACTHVCTHTYTSKYNLKDSLFGIFFWKPC